MSEQDRIRWDEKYRGKSQLPFPSPAEWLIEVAQTLIPGKAWDVACGVGQNSLYLASLGWQVDAVDISPLGLEVGRLKAGDFGDSIRWIPSDLDQYTPPRNEYDLVFVCRFLDRKRLPGEIEKSLKPEGKLIYETFVVGQCERTDNHLQNGAFVLKSGELPLLFPSLKTAFYAEEHLSDRTVARLLAVKPS